MVTKIQHRAEIVVPDLGDKQFKADTDVRSQLMILVDKTLENETLEPGTKLLVDLRILIWPKEEMKNGSH